MPTQLFVLEKARTMARQMYRVIDALPSVERFNLASQMRRATVSVISNIAEGSRRIHPKEKRQLYSTAFASAAELEAQLTLVRDVDMVPSDQSTPAHDSLQEVLRLMNRLTHSFRSF